MYIKNKIGPRIDPCGTPNITSSGLDIADPIRAD